jgi:redox-sensitive bicupin YhaK (pirin superfamily)
LYQRVSVTIEKGIIKIRESILFKSTTTRKRSFPRKRPHYHFFYSLLGDPSANSSDSSNHGKIEKDNRDLSFIMAGVRTVIRIFDARETIEGAGVRLRRAFGYHQVPLFDPFLMLDDFRSDKPEDYLAGFPWHPHRGIETVTYMLEGRVEHGDSMGHSGSVDGGDVQWMTAGSGIIHQEMPQPVKARMGGFQLWVNLPRAHKMMNPRYQEVKSGMIPEIFTDDGVSLRVISGTYGDISGPVRDIVVDPDYFDVKMAPHREFVHRVREGYTLCTYTVDGEGLFDDYSDKTIRKYQTALFGEGIGIHVRTTDEPMRFLLFSGKPIREPVAWFGPIVMNTEEELEQAFREYREGTFIRNNERNEEQDKRPVSGPRRGAWHPPATK